MANQNERGFDYKSVLENLEPSKVSLMLPGWTFKDKIFRQVYQGEYLEKEYDGWLFLAPEGRLYIELDRDMRQVFFYDSSHSITVPNLQYIVTKAKPNSNQVGFLSKNEKCYLTFLKFDQSYQITVDRKYGKTFHPVLRWQV